MDISTAFHLGEAINLRRHLFQSHLIANYGIRWRWYLMVMLHKTIRKSNDDF